MPAEDSDYLNWYKIDAAPLMEKLPLYFKGSNLMEIKSKLPQWMYFTTDQIYLMSNHKL